VIAATAVVALGALRSQPACAQTGGSPQPTQTVQVDGEVKTDNQDDELDRILQVITALGAGLGVPFIALQVLFARRAEKDQRTAAIFARYSTREFQSVASQTLSFLRVKDAVECLRKAEAFERRAHADDHCLPRARDRPNGPKASLNDLFEVLSFFEDLGAAYNRNDVTRRKVHEQLPTPPVQLFTEGWWYICWRRGGKAPGGKPWRFTPERLVRSGETNLYAQFEWMVKTLKKRVPSLRDEDKDTDAEAKTRLVLCIPAARHQASSADWTRARSLSKLISAHPAEITTLADSLEQRCADSGAPRHSEDASPCKVVIVPKSIDEDRDEAKRRQWLAQRLECALARLPHEDVEDTIRAVA
jgi:hypothetical protein